MMRHEASARNRKKALHHAECLLDEINDMDCKLRSMVEENVRYMRGRALRLVDRLKSEVHNDGEQK